MEKLKEKIETLKKMIALEKNEKQLKSHTQMVSMLEYVVSIAQ